MHVVWESQEPYCTAETETSWPPFLSLHKLAQTMSPAQKSTKEAIHAREQDSETDDINTRIHQQVRHYLAADMKFSYRFDKLNINRLLSEMDPKLWAFVISITRSVSERKGCTSKASDQATPTHHVKKVRRLFCLCALLFCTDDRCYIPLHNLITDIVESCGGSTLLVRILNRLGVCSSADTLARTIQYRVKEREQRGYEQECSPDTLTITSADNIDFLHSYARSFQANNCASCSTQTKHMLWYTHFGVYYGWPVNADRTRALTLSSSSSTQGESTSTLLTSESSDQRRHTCTAASGVQQTLLAEDRKRSL
jgi:hypothetical protein